MLRIVSTIGEGGGEDCQIKGHEMTWVKTRLVVS